MWDFFKNNYKWLLSGIAVPFVIWVFRLFNKKKEITDPKTENTQNNTVNVNIGDDSRTKRSSEKIQNLSKPSFGILFIDDQHEKFRVVQILKRAGWSNTKAKKNIINLDDADAFHAQVIFIDINGVGKELFEDEGLGLALAMKKKYPHKKIVIYSSQNEGNRFHEALDLVDGRMSKNADPYQFINRVETFFEERSK